MKSFKEFLDESYEVSSMAGGGYMNDTNVAGNNVTTSFIPLRSKDHYEADFTVNSNWDDRYSGATHKHLILHHVGKVLNHFINTHSPKKIEFQAYNKVKHNDSFGEFAQKLAKHHGYSYDSEYLGSNTIKHKLTR